MDERGNDSFAWAGVAIVVAIGLTITFAVLWVPYGGGYGMMGLGIGWGALFMMVPALFIVFLLLSALARPPIGMPGPGLTAREVLDLRYARGELHRDEYLRVRAELELPVA